MLLLNLANDPDALLLAELRQGSTVAFNRLYKKYAPTLMGIINRMTGDEKAAGTMMQQVFQMLWQERNTAPQYRIWDHLLHTGRKLTETHSQHNNSNAKIPDTMVFVDNTGKLAETSAAESGEPNETGLNELEQLVLDLVYIKGYSIDQAATLLNLSGNKLKRIVKGSITTLKRYRA